MYITRWKAVLVGVVALAVIVPATAFAATSVFDDVPDDSVYVNDINWLAASEVTKGCNPPTNTRFCPSSNVTREQMAAFMHRLASNQVVDAATAVDADNADTLDGKDSTAFLAANGKAVDADMLDGKDSAKFVEHDPIEMTESGTAWMVRSQITAGPIQVNDRLAHSTVFTGQGDVVIGLTGPAAMSGTAYGLASFDLCLFGGNVTRVAAVAINFFGPDADDAEIYIDVTVQDGSVVRTTGCYSYAVNTQVGQGIGLQVTLDGSAELFSVKSVWTPGAAQG